MKSRIALLLTAFVLWMLLSWSFEWQHVVVGAVVSLIVAFIAGDIFLSRSSHGKSIFRFLHLAYYIPVFVWECFKANLDVAVRVVHPDLPIRPGIVKVKTNLKSDTGITFLANSITLTPGTLSVDVDKDDGVLYVHWINVKDSDTEKATQAIVQRFEKILGRVFA